MALSKDAYALVDHEFAEASEKKKFLKAKLQFNALPVWTSSQRKRLQGVESVRRAVEEFDHLSNGSISRPLRGTIYDNLLPERQYSCRELGYSSNITDQGATKTCWAHAICSMLESQVRKFDVYPGDPTNVVFSRRQLVESRNMKDTYQRGDKLFMIPGRIKRMGGILEEKHFPRKKNKDGGYILNNADKKKVKLTVGKITDHYDVSRIKLQRMIMEHGQLAVNINLDECTLLGKDVMMLATKKSRKKNAKPNLHSVVVDGWIHIKGVAFWNIKNSWGEECGQNGYFLLPMEQDTRLRQLITVSKLTAKRS